MKVTYTVEYPPMPPSRAEALWAEWCAENTRLRAELTALVETSREMAGSRATLNPGWNVQERPKNHPNAVAMVPYIYGTKLVICVPDKFGGAVHHNDETPSKFGRRLRWENKILRHAIEAIRPHVENGNLAMIISGCWEVLNENGTFDDLNG